nr:MAG TPA: hypothetical protein [Caudoviricetes sp.]
MLFEILSLLKLFSFFLLLDYSKSLEFKLTH